MTRMAGHSNPALTTYGLRRIGWCRVRPSRRSWSSKHHARVIIAAMKPAVIAWITILMTVIVAAQPRLTFDYPAMARRIVQQLALKAGERVMTIAHPGIFEDLIPYVRYEVLRAGAIDLGVAAA